MIAEHNAKGGSLGKVMGMRVLTLEEARSKGIENQTSPRMIYLGVEPSPGTTLNSIEYASIGLVPQLKDEEGTIHKYWLSDLSATNDPHIRYEQTPASKLSQIQFSSAPTLNSIRIDAFCIDGFVPTRKV